jgi:hypothetical protein
VAGKAVSAVRFGGRSFKGYCAALGNGRMGKVDFALASETLK